MLESQKEELLSKVRELEKSIHLLEAGNLEATNKLQISHYDKEKEIREKAYEDGFEKGVASIRKDHQIELTNLHSQHRGELAVIEREAEIKGEAKARMEIETQMKAFGVKISPYIKIFKKDKTLGFKKTYISQTGYQYQLMVNGIPAFSPHIVIEHTEHYEELDNKRVDLFAEAALKLSIGVAEIYSGAAKGAVTIGSIIKDINTKDVIIKDTVSEKKDL